MLTLSAHNTLKLTTFALMVALTTACGGSGSSSSSTASNDNDGGTGASESGGSASGGGGDETTGSGGAVSGNYDLSEYIFPSAVLSNGGEVSFVEKSYSKDAATEGFAISLDRSFSNNNGDIDEYSSGELYRTHVIGNSQIVETFHDPVMSRTSARYANIGDVYMDATTTAASGGIFAAEQNATCELEAHLDSFDLSTATGDQALTSGVYEDVLQVKCVTSFVANSVKSPHTTLTSYFAKGTGVIFNEGNVIILGDVYLVEEY